MCPRSSSDSSSSSSSSSSSKKKQRRKAKKGKTAKVDKAADKAKARQTQVFSKAAAREQQKKDREAERAKLKGISSASSLAAKVKKQNVEIRRVLAHPLLCHVPMVTQQPLHDLLKQSDNHLKLLEQVIGGDREWQAELGQWSPKEGTMHMKLVSAMLGQLTKMKPTSKK